MFIQCNSYSYKYDNRKESNNYQSPTHLRNCYLFIHDNDHLKLRIINIDGIKIINFVLFKYCILLRTFSFYSEGKAICINTIIIFFEKKQNNFLDIIEF